MAPGRLGGSARAPASAKCSRFAREAKTSTVLPICQNYTQEYTNSIQNENHLCTYLS